MLQTNEIYKRKQAMVVHNRFSYWLGHPFTSTVTQGDDDDKGSEKEDEEPNWFIEGAWDNNSTLKKIEMDSTFNFW